MLAVCQNVFDNSEQSGNLRQTDKGAEGRFSKTITSYRKD